MNDRSRAHAVLSNISAAVDESGALITYDVLPTVWGDGAQLGQVIQNLMTNALKYRKAGETPQIHISSEQRNGEWIISITDNGIGFDQNQADRIFGVFKRLHGRDIPGTGMGLSIEKKSSNGIGAAFGPSRNPVRAQDSHLRFPSLLNRAAPN